jgi:hypothetical protein
MHSAHRCSHVLVREAWTLQIVPSQAATTVHGMQVTSHPCSQCCWCFLCMGQNLRLASDAYL